MCTSVNFLLFYFFVDTVDKSPFVVIFIKAFQYLLRAVRFLVHLAI